MDKIFLNNVGDLSEVQRASFYRFLSTGITQELAYFPNPFLAYVKVPTRKKNRVRSYVYLYPEKIKLEGPNNTTDNCLRRGITYSLSLYVSGEYQYEYDEEIDLFSTLNQSEKIQRIRVQQDIFLGEIPLMTEEGTFILNGCERVVISQIIRSPGIYFRSEKVSVKRTIETATIISNKGLWTKFISDIDPKTNKERLYIKFNDYKPSLSLKDDPEDTLDEKRLFIYEIIGYFGLTFAELYDSLEFGESIFKHQYFKKLRDHEDTYELIEDLFLNHRSDYFSIGEVGRYKVNKKLKLNLPKQATYLTALDFVKIIDGLITVKYDPSFVDDIDHMKNKQIRSIGDLLQNQIRVGFYRLQKVMSEKEGISSFRRTQNPFSIDIERWILDPRPITTAFREFFLSSQLSQYLDQTNPLAELTHKRRISVFGPNGLKRDHVSTVIRDIHPSQYGRLCPIETPEGQNAGLITSIAMYGRINPLGWIDTPYFFVDNGKINKNLPLIYLNPEQEAKTSIAFCDIKFNLNNKNDNLEEVKEEYLSVKEDYIFRLEKTKKVSFLTMSPLQIVSLATSLIPFVEHNDANRALMGSNMQRQALPLLYSQKAIVGTGMESNAILDSGLIIKSVCEGKVFHTSSHFIEIKDLENQKIFYYLRKYAQSNQETAINQRPIVWQGEKIFSGQIIADGPSTQDGELALGRNLTVAYMPWDGYNYEDAIVLNERIVYEDCLTSLHIEEHEISINYLEKEFLTYSIPYAMPYSSKNLDQEGIIKVGSYVKENDVLVGKIVYYEEDLSVYAKLLKAIYRDMTPPYRDVSLKVPHGTEGRVVDIRTFSSNSSEKESFPIFSDIIRIYIAQIRKIQIGDKLSGRHGNKGIISKILPRQDMPYLPDGTPIDIILNPLGVPSRMNVGQVFECLLGLAGEKLGRRFKISPFDEVFGKEASRVLVNQKLKEASIKANLPWIYNSLFPGKVMLRDGRTGEYFDNPITVGKSYILKLIHLVEDKIHARATGPYSMITEQPLAGKAQRGGQRFGEMEVWALEAYGCAHTLQEILTIKSDDIDGRNDMYESIMVRREVVKPSPLIPEAFLALMRELNALGLDFSMKKLTGGFYSTTTLRREEKKVFKEVEKRLKLRKLIERKKSELSTKANREDEISEIKKEEKIRLLEQIKKYWMYEQKNHYTY
jgi:DNA-directed RNA polymerase subunit beta